MLNSLQNVFEKGIFANRWVLAPLYVCLVLALPVIGLKFLEEFWHMVTHFESLSTQFMVIAVLELVDVLLVGNLLVMIIFSGYENFVSKIEVARTHVDRPSWMGKIDYSGMKLKIIGSIVAISSIELLKLFIDLGTMKPSSDPAAMDFFRWKMIGMIILHGVFVFSGLIFAFTEKSAHTAIPAHGKGE
jgi:uncharacterized protein (TIGR00645 family)